jgi:hypothetical protein
MSVERSSSIFTRQMYHGTADSSREAPGLQTEARQEGGASHGTLNGTIDHDEDARRVFFLVRKRLLPVEEPAQGNIASLTHSSIAGESRSHLDKRRMALGNRRKSHRDPDNHGLPAGCKSLERRREKADRIVEMRG